MNFVTDFVWEFITLFSEMAPFLLLGFLLAGILHRCSGRQSLASRFRFVAAV